MTKSKLTEARRKFEEIIRESERKGISRSNLLSLSTTKKFIEKIEKKSEKSRWKSKYLGIGAALFAAFVFSFNLHTLHGFSNFWLKWNYGGAKDQLCTIPMPDELTKIFRPPVPCSICKDITEVEKVSNISPESFERLYAYSGRPVIVTDAMTNWTAQHVFDFEFFREIYNERMEQWRMYNCQFFPYNTEFRHLSEVFNMSEERAVMAEGSAPWYVGWSNCDDEINQILRRHYQKPYFLPATAETKKLDWIFMGTTGFGAPIHGSESLEEVIMINFPTTQCLNPLNILLWMASLLPDSCEHYTSREFLTDVILRLVVLISTTYENVMSILVQAKCMTYRYVKSVQKVDNVEHPSWQAQLKGRKKWNLEPPPECLYVCSSFQVVVEPGEIIVLDTNQWYHSTLIVSKEMSITIGAEYD